MTTNFKKHLGMIGVIFCSAALGMNWVQKNEIMSFIMGIFITFNVFSTFYWAKKEVLDETISDDQ